MIQFGRQTIVGTREISHFTYVFSLRLYRKPNLLDRRAAPRQQYIWGWVLAKGEKVIQTFRSILSWFYRDKKKCVVRRFSLWVAVVFLKQHILNLIQIRTASMIGLWTAHTSYVLYQVWFTHPPRKWGYNLTPKNGPEKFVNHYK